MRFLRNTPGWACRRIRGGAPASVRHKHTWPRRHSPAGGRSVGGLYECRGDASSFEWFGDNGVTDVECAVFDAVGHMGRFALLCQGEAMLLGLVLDVHDALIFIGYI